MSISKKIAILNAAEELFARRGLRGASLRQIASKAVVDVSLITYHFKTKDQLFAAVIERRTRVFNREQNFYLEECERRAAPSMPCNLRCRIAVRKIFNGGFSFCMAP